MKSNDGRHTIQSVTQAALYNLTCASKTALCSCILTTLLCGFTYVWLVSPKNIIKWTPYLVTYNGDDDIFVTSSVLSIANSDSYQSKIVLLGDSSFREAFHEYKLGDTLAETGSPFSIADLRTGGQTLLETLAIIDALPDTDNSLLIIGTSVRKFIVTDDAKEYALNGTRRGFTSVAVDNYLVDTGEDVRRKTGIYGIDNYHFLIPRFVDYIKRPLSEPIERIKYQSTISEKIDPKALDLLEEKFVRRIELTEKGYLEQIEIGKDIFQRIYKISKQKGYEVLVVETPLNPDFIHNTLGIDFYEFYINSSAYYFENNFQSVYYHNPLIEFTVASDHFIDVNHLQNQKSIEGYSDSVGQKILQIVDSRI